MKLLSKMVLFAGFFLFFSSCSFIIPENNDRENVEFLLPQWPPETYKGEQPLYPQLSRWIIEVCSADGVEKFSTTESHLQFNLNKNRIFGIKASPVTLDSTGNEILFFKPAGSIYPYSYDAGQQRLTWIEGYACSILQTLYESKKETGVTTEHMISFLEGFNWYKFTETLEKKANQSEQFYNPWLLDSFTLMDNLSYGNFKSSYLDPKYTLELQLAKLNLPVSVSLLSSYVPENRNITSNGTIVVKKECYSVYSCNTDYAAVILYSSSKKVSLQYVFMPIFKEEI